MWNFASSHRTWLFKKNYIRCKGYLSKNYVTEAVYRKSTNFFQIFPVHGTIIRQHVQQIKLDYLARKCNFPVNIPSRDTSFFLSFLPSFPYSFLLFTLCVLPLHNCFFLFSFSVITSFYVFVSFLFPCYYFILCVCFKYFWYVLICSLRYLSQTLYAYPVSIMPHQVEYRLRHAHPIFFNPF